MEIQNRKTAWKEQLALTIVLLVALALAITILLLVKKQQNEDALAQPRYDASADIAAAMERLSETEQKPELVAAAPGTTSQKVMLVFEGVSDAADMEEIASLLHQNQFDATFFFSGLDALNNPDAVSVPMDEGFAIGNNGYSATAQMQSFSQKTVVSDICRAGVLIEYATGDQPTVLSFRQTEYTDEVMQAASACNIDRIIQPSYYIGANTASSKADVEALIGRMPRGSILCVRLSGVLTAGESAASATLLSGADTAGTGEAAQAGATATAAPTAVPATATAAETAAHGTDMMTVTRWVIETLKSTDYASVSQTLEQQNNGAMAESLTNIHTTARAVAFTFSGMGSNTELVNLLNTLDACKATCTFFVTQDEMKNNAEQVSLILSRGHDLGIAVQPTAASKVSELCEAILLARETLANSFQYPDATLLRQSRSAPTDAFRQAASATGCTICEQGMLAVQDTDENETDLQVIFDKLFPEHSGVLRMGEIVHFRLGVYQGGDTILADLVEKIVKEGNIYAVRSLKALMADTEDAYTYPLPAEQILPAVKDQIYAGQLEGNVMNALARRYIGTTWLTNSMLPGFTPAEILRLDRKGVVRNPDNAVFLTFDDWGTDQTIMSLLQVLREYNVKATFFVRTNNVHYNPNLLRAIALEGHAIASHTSEHYALAVDDQGTGKSFRELTEEERAGLEADLIASYQELQNIVGDIEVDGRPALTRLFRPPTLAVSKSGLTTVLDCGFDFSVSGGISTQDYSATKAESLASTIRANLRPGYVLVMHMSDNSKYTAAALEIVLSLNAAKLEEEQVKFARLDDYLIDGYNFRTGQ